MSSITRATIASEIRDQRENEREQESRNAYMRQHYSNPDYAPRTRQAQNEAARDKAYDTVIPSYAWPGGYEVAYYIEGEYDPTSDVLCWGCAREYLKLNKDGKVAAECCDGYEGEDSRDHLYCDDCHGVICEAWQREEEETAD